MREIHRIKQQRYTDSDVLAFYMKYREQNNSPFIREVGDFIAHERRDNGVTLETTVFIYSQIAFFKRYQSNEKIELNPVGPCPWWLKQFYLGKINDVNPKKLRIATGLNRKQALKVVRSWFPAAEQYPTRIDCKNMVAFRSISDLFASYLVGKDVFQEKDIERELRLAFKREGVPIDELRHFLVATAVLLAGRSCEIAPDFKAHIDLSINKLTPEGIENRLRSGQETNGIGVLRVIVSTQYEKKKGNVNIVLDLMNVEVAVGTYFDLNLLKMDETGKVILDGNRPLLFERAAQPMVFQGN